MKDKVIRWEWKGSVILLTLLSLTGILLPAAVVYFMINLLRFENAVDDAEAAADYLRAKV